MTEQQKKTNSSSKSMQMKSQTVIFNNVNQLKKMTPTRKGKHGENKIKQRYTNWDKNWT